MLKTLHRLGLDSKEKIRVKGVEVAPRDVVAAALPDPATLGERMTGKTCAGTLVTGLGKDGAAAQELPLPRRRQRVVDAGVRLTGGRLADGAQSRRCAGAPRRGLRGPAPASSVPRRSRRGPTSTSWPISARRTASSSWRRSAQSLPLSPRATRAWSGCSRSCRPRPASRSSSLPRRPPGWRSG